jgi:hypothetical protein
MSSVVSILVLGFVLGMRHALDPDHVVAVTTIVARERRVWASSLVGAFWGLGHTATILLVGGAIVLFGLVIPPRLGLGMELTVAAMLVVLGVANLAGLVRGIRSKPAPLATAEASPSRRAWSTSGRPLAIGVVHGLAGSAAVALLVLATIREPRWSLLYLGVFGVGTIAGMMLLTTALALPFVFTARRFDRVAAGLTGAAGLASVAFGAFLSYELVVVHGLFSAAPLWTPQ